MQATLFKLASSHSLGFVAVATAICLVTGWLLAVLMQQAEAARHQSRRMWLAGIVLVAGVGVWTTHFMAMLGYRGDIALGYDAGITAISALIAALAVGLPLAATVLPKNRWTRGAMGALSGAGISAMHLSGMAALQGCLQSQSTITSLLAITVGATLMALARSVPAIRASQAWTCATVSAAVTGAHFTSIAGTALTPVADGSAMRAHLNLSLFTAGGAMLLFLATILAILAARRFDAQEEAHSATLTTALQNMSNGILTVSTDGRIGLFNKRLCEMLNLRPADVATAMPLDTFLDNVGRASGWDHERVAKVLSNHHAWMRSGVQTQVEHSFDDGRILSITCQPVSGGAVLTYDDVTNDRQAQKQIMDLAFKDPLTGLANRRALHQRMEEGFAGERAFDLLLIDLDRFKFVNDTYGHSVGDQLLVQVAQRVKQAAEGADFIARLGGDEMAVLVHGDRDLPDTVAGAIVRCLGEPFELGETTVVIGASVGLCRTAETSGVEELMQRADLALYESKRRGRGRTTRYQAGMLEAVAKRNQLENDMRAALAGRQFHLAYQPVRSLGEDRIIGYEALIRWEHPSRGSIAPDQFIPLAEETGQIITIGAWVLEEACREAATWPGDQHIAVNVSPVQLRSPLLLAHVVAALDRSGLPLSRLELELTETAMVEDGKQIAHVLADLRALGIRIAMDDFGTGYSSLAHLRDMPLDRIKIDRSFVAAAETDPHCMAVLKAITQMGRDMDIATLAEGVETQSQLAVLQALGCGAVQGYLIGRPEARPVSEPSRMSDAA